MFRLYTKIRRALVGHEQGYDQPVDVDNVPLSKSVIKSQRAVILGQDLPDGPCDALQFSADTDAEIIAADDTVAVTGYYAGRVWHPISAKRVVSVTGQASVIAGYQVGRSP